MKPVLIIGPLPPPMMGPAVGTAMVIRAFEHCGARVVHLNTQDRRTIFATGVLDVRNVLLGALHAVILLYLLVRYRVALAYVPVSQSRWGFARDAVLIAILRLLKRPVAIHLRGAKLQEFYRSRTRLERMVVRRSLASAEIAIALTPSLKSVYDGLIAGERVRVLENAIPDPWPEGVDELATKRRQRRGRVRALFVGNDFRMKGALTAVQSLSLLSSSHVELALVGAASSDMVDELSRLARETGVEDRIIILGERLDASKIRELEDADLFVYPTENDGQPLVVLEAMAAGLPVISTNVGGVAETVNGTGIIVDPGDPRAVAHAIDRLARDLALRESLGRAARERFVERYSLEPFFERCRSVFAEWMPQERAERP